MSSLAPKRSIASPDPDDRTAAITAASGVLSLFEDRFRRLLAHIDLDDRWALDAALMNLSLAAQDLGDTFLHEFLLSVGIMVEDEIEADPDYEDNLRRHAARIAEGGGLFQKSDQRR